MQGWPSIQRQLHCWSRGAQARVEVRTKQAPPIRGQIGMLKQRVRLGIRVNVHQHNLAVVQVQVPRFQELRDSIGCACTRQRTLTARV